MGQPGLAALGVFRGAQKRQLESTHCSNVQCMALQIYRLARTRTLLLHPRQGIYNALHLHGWIRVERSHSSFCKLHVAGPCRIGSQLFNQRACPTENHCRLIRVVGRQRRWLFNMGLRIGYISNKRQVSYEATNPQKIPFPRERARPDTKPS